MFTQALQPIQQILITDDDAALSIYAHVGEPPFGIDNQSRHRRHWILTVHARAINEDLHHDRSRALKETIRCKHACRLAVHTLH